MESINLKSKKIFCNILDEMKGRQHFTIENGDNLPLTVELLDEGIITEYGKGNTYTFCQYYSRNGDLMQSPEICFIYIDNRSDKSKDWDQVLIIPYMYQYAEICMYELSIVIVNYRIQLIHGELQKKHTRLANIWLSELETLGFLNVVNNEKYNYQIRLKSDKRDWADIEVLKRNATDRFDAIQYGKRLARVFNAEIRMTDGPDHRKSSATYLRDEFDNINQGGY